MDVFSEEKRSEVMSHIRSRDTKPELFVRRLLFHEGFRYRLQAKSMPGRPDIVLARWRVAVFVNGCFWHMHEGCRLSARPSAHAGYWLPKLQRNRERDLESERALLDAGWRVLIVWECACRKRLAEALSARMAAFIRNESGREGPVLSIGRADMEAPPPSSRAPDPEEPAREPS